MVEQLSFHTPLEALTLTAEDDTLIAADWGWAAEICETPFLKSARDQILAYFKGERTSFSLPLNPPGTPFQKRVWTALDAIPFGERATYGEIAKDLQTAPRAIGQACGRNPLPLIRPCHRVVSASGKPGGYTGADGTNSKIWLLAFERYHLLKRRCPR